MGELSRRTFLTTTSMSALAGAAFVTGLTRLPALAAHSRSVASTTSDEAAPDEAQATPLGEDMVAHVRDVTTGEIALLVGTREIVYRDRPLVGRLLRGARDAAGEG